MTAYKLLAIAAIALIAWSPSQGMRYLKQAQTTMRLKKILNATAPSPDKIKALVETTSTTDNNICHLIGASRMCLNVNRPAFQEILKNPTLFTAKNKGNEIPFVTLINAIPWHDGLGSAATLISTLAPLPFTIGFGLSCFSAEMQSPALGFAMFCISPLLVTICGLKLIREDQRLAVTRAFFEKTPDNPIIEQLVTMSADQRRNFISKLYPYLSEDQITRLEKIDSAASLRADFIK